jgi:hypothetical protein
MKRVSGQFLVLFFLTTLFSTPLPHIPLSPIPIHSYAASVESNVPGISARLVTTLILHDGRRIRSGGKFYRYRNKVRFEPEGTPGLTAEIELLDFDRSALYRLIPENRIYFESRLSPARINKAVREGWVPPPKGWREDRIFLRDDVWEGNPARIYLQVQREPSAGRGGPARYALLWTGRDSGVPLRVVYTDPQSHPIMVDFRELAVGTLDPKLFSPPPDYANLNPY